MELLSILFLALAVSIDGLAAGLSLGLLGVKVPPLPLMVISMTSALAIFLSMLFGRLLAQAFSFQLAQIFGASILLLFGGFLIKKHLFPRRRKGKPFRIRISLFGVIVEIHREPLRADLDSSGRIDLKEAYLLGFALAIDAAGVGLGASLLGLNLFLIPLAVGVEKFLLLTIGARWGMRYGNLLGKGRQDLIPGIILLLLGLFQLMTVFRG